MAPRLFRLEALCEAKCTLGFLGDVVPVPTRTLQALPGFGGPVTVSPSVSALLACLGSPTASLALADSSASDLANSLADSLASALAHFPRRLLVTPANARSLLSLTSLAGSLSYACCCSATCPRLTATTSFFLLFPDCLSRHNLYVLRCYLGRRSSRRRLLYLAAFWLSCSTCLWRRSSRRRLLCGVALSAVRLSFSAHLRRLSPRFWRLFFFCSWFRQPPLCSPCGVDSPASWLPFAVRLWRRFLCFCLLFFPFVLVCSRFSSRVRC